MWGPSMYDRVLVHHGIFWTCYAIIDGVLPLSDAGLGNILQAIHHGSLWACPPKNLSVAGYWWQGSAHNVQMLF